MSLASRLNRRVTIQQQLTAQDALGQPVNTWETVAEVWAEVKDVSGREYIAAGGVQGLANTKITVRHIAGLVPAMRVICGADSYNIEAVLGQDNRTLLLMCRRSA